MALGRQLFRESALQRLQSPEQLDQVLQVTSPKGWLALTAIWTLLVVVVVWSFVGEVPSKEQGRGIIVQLDTLKVVQAEGTGRLDAIHVGVGDLVEAGTAVALINRDDLQDQIDDEKEQLEQMREQHRTLADLDEQRATLERELAAEERTRLDQWIVFLEQRIGEVEYELGRFEDAKERGAVNELEIFRVKERIELKRSELAQARLRLQKIDAELRTADMDRLGSRTQRQLEEHKLAGRIEVLERQHERESRVVTSFTGRVTEIRAADHTLVESGDDIMLIEPLEPGGEAPRVATVDAGGEELECPCRSGRFALMEAIVYVSARTGQDRIRPGQIVHVAPSTVKREEHGSIIGMVRWIAPYTTTAPAMMSVLNDRNLVDDFRASVGVPLEMRVSLCGDDETVSGLEWTSSEGPPTEISAGTLCEASVTVEERRPIDLVIPNIKEALGVD